jgi:threonine/homoserine/homoserine lactone efflux protein
VLLLFLGATVLASITPGPVVLLTIAVALRSGVNAALKAIAGICTGSLSYLAVALAGLLAVLISHRALFQAVQLAGALYLVYLGLRMVWSGWQAAGVIAVDTSPHERPYFDGLVTQLSNPKAILYWTALLPPFLDTAQPVARQLVLLVAIGIAVDIVVLSAYALGAASVRRWLQTPRFQRALNLAAGGLFVLTGAGLVYSTVSVYRGG